MWAMLGKAVFTFFVEKVWKSIVSFLTKWLYVRKRMKEVEKRNEVKHEDYKNNPSDDNFSKLP